MHRGVERERGGGERERKRRERTKGMGDYEHPGTTAFFFAKSFMQKNVG
jgi:hypothetical protein